MDLHFANDLLRNPWIKKLLILVGYALVAVLIDLFIQQVLKRIAKKYTSTDLDDRAIEIIHRPVLLTVFFIGILHAAGIKPALSSPWNSLIPGVVKSLVLLFWTIATLRIFSMLADWYFEKNIGRGKIGVDLLLLLKNVIRIVVAASALIWLLSIWKVNLAPLFASAGIAGIAVALAAKDSLANFFGGISIFADKTFTVGNYIQLDSGERGEVIEVGIRSTRIKTFDDTVITIPNSILANSRIINESVPTTQVRVKVPVGVAYGSDLEQVEMALLQVAGRDPEVLANPEPRVRVRAFGASSVDIDLLCWTNRPEDRVLVAHRLLKGIYLAFQQHQISIPFPQQDLHLKGDLSVLEKLARPDASP